VDLEVSLPIAGQVDTSSTARPRMAPSDAGVDHAAVPLDGTDLPTFTDTMYATADTPRRCANT
jgi:hypothetical protein